MFFPRLPVSCTFLGRQFPGNPWPLVVLPESWVRKRRQRLLLFDTTKVRPRCNLAKDLLPGKTLRSRGVGMLDLCIYIYISMYKCMCDYICMYIYICIFVYIVCSISMTQEYKLAKLQTYHSTATAWHVTRWQIQQWYSEGYIVEIARMRMLASTNMWRRRQTWLKLWSCCGHHDHD